MMSSRQSTEQPSVPSLHRLTESIFFKVCLALFFLFGLILLLPFSQSALLSFGGRLFGKIFASARWGEFLTEYGGKLVLASFLLTVYLVRRRIETNSPASLPLFDRGFLFFVFAVWFTYAGASVLLHEPWRDEVHAWTMARAMTPAQLFHEMRYEGHFVPWFYLVFPFARLGFPGLTLNLISFAIMGGCVFFLLFKSPFSIYAKAAVVLTVPMAYYYPAVSRCYCLYALCVLSLACLFRRRMERPFLYALLLGLLANSHAYAEGMVAVLTVEFSFSGIVCPWKNLGRDERRKRLLSVVLVCLFVLVAFLQVAPAFGNTTAANSRSRLTMDTFFSVVIEVFLALDVSVLSQFLLLALVLVSFRCLVWHRLVKQLFIMDLSLLWMLLFAAVLYGASIPSRAWMWFFVLLFAVWQMGQAGRDRQSEAQPESLKSKAASAIIILVSLAAFNPSVSIRDWKGEFSTAKQTAAFVAESIRPGEPVLLPYAHQNYSLIFFAPSLGYKSLETGEDIRFFSWSREKEMSGFGDIHSCIKARFDESGCDSLLIVGLNNGRTGFGAQLGYSYDELLKPGPAISGESFSVLRVYDRISP